MDKPDYPCGADHESPCKTAEGLSHYLADLNLLYIKLHNLHWNVVGEGFFCLHHKTQELYEAIGEKLDRVAEHIRAMGLVPPASMEEYLHLATIRELPGKPFADKEAAMVIVEDFTCVLKLLRKIVEVAEKRNDGCTVDMLTEDICFFGKNLWMLRAYLGHP
jgi:starvation-inducible DNA-binding protein